jgi:hypothetical protein
MPTTKIAVLDYMAVPVETSSAECETVGGI